MQEIKSSCKESERFVKVKTDNDGEDPDGIFKFLLYKTKDSLQEDDFDIEICNEGSLVSFEAEVIDLLDEQSTIEDLFNVEQNNEVAEQNASSFGDSITRTNITFTNVFQQPVQQIKSRRWRKIEMPIKTLEGEFTVMQWVFEDCIEKVPIIIEAPVEDRKETDFGTNIVQITNEPLQLSENSTDDTKSDPDYDPNKFFSRCSPDRPEACSFPNCLKKFRDKTGLRKHLKTHGPRLHICAECGKSFLESSKLKRHRLVHTGGQPYPCPWCNKRFALAFNLKTHLRVHTGEKPFGCQFDGCQRRFAQSTNLKYHELTHMRELTADRGNKRHQTYKIGKRKSI